MLILILLLFTTGDPSAVANPKDSVNESRASELLTLLLERELLEKETVADSKDMWDIFGVLSEFFAGVVIAIVGWRITYVLQNKQTAAEDTRANKDRVVSQGQLTVELMSHLFSESAQERQVAIITLRDTVPEKTYNDILKVLAKKDDSEQVRQEAIGQLGLSKNEQVTKTLGEIATDKNRSDEERILASQSTDNILFSQNLSSKTFLSASSTANEAAYESSELGGGVYTHYLIEGLNGAAADQEGTVYTRDLSNYVTQKVRAYRYGPTVQTPTFFSFNGDKIPILAKESKYSQVTGLFIGVDKCLDPSISELAYAASDAKKVFNLFKSQIKSDALHLLTDEQATKQSVLENLGQIVAQSNKDTLFIFYYAGQSNISTSGQTTLVLHDYQHLDPMSQLSLSDLKPTLNRIGSGSNVFFMDTCYAKGFFM